MDSTRKRTATAVPTPMRSDVKIPGRLTGQTAWKKKPSLFPPGDLNE